GEVASRNLLAGAEITLSFCRGRAAKQCEDLRRGLFPANRDFAQPADLKLVKSVHQGLDYRVGPGTPVMAVNSGTVLLARPLYFEGNCVVIDHGQGLLSLYLHLSELKVKEGEHVDRGIEIGLSGATGRATGPHLHLAVRWQGVYVDPAVLLRLPLPDINLKSAIR
ncbi:MAG TPA: M23 family metallopeptidase, partial [Terriglobales bacterium]|nr:M23 family metallopeptidase [Terriglobales bacterium]